MTKKKLYTLTDEHRAQLKPWAEKWIANAMSTKPMDDTDREAVRVAVAGLYSAADLKQPNNVVFAGGPVTASVAAGIAAGVWYLRDHDMRKQLGAYNESTLFTAIPLACAAVFGGRPVKRVDAATDAATRAATHDATTAATRMAKFMLQCCSSYYNMWDGGNQWSAWMSYLSFFRHVANLDLPEYEKVQHYEAASIHGGPRIMHPDFCMISDRPEFIHRDEQNRPHSLTGPFCRWRDGWSLYYVHGVRVPTFVIESPEMITVAHVDREENAEVRRVMIERFGGGRSAGGGPEAYLKATNAKVIDHEEGIGTLRRRDVPNDEPLVMVEVVNSTPEPDGRWKHYWLRVPPNIETAREAVAWTFGMKEADYRPNIET